MLFSVVIQGMILCVVTEYMCHVYVRSDRLSSVLISDPEYPQRVAFSLLNKVCMNILFDVISKIELSADFSEVMSAPTAVEVKTVNQSHSEVMTIDGNSSPFVGRQIFVGMSQ